jgi:hypothetical protein
MIDKKEKKNGIMIYYVDKNYDDEKMNKVMNTKLKRSDIDFIIDHDADVYTTNGELLLRFRKRKLDKETTQTFYDNVIQYATRKTNNRGSASGSKTKSVYNNPKIMTNIIGYFDKLSPKQKFRFKQLGIPLPKCTVRKTRFLDEFPEKFEKATPFIEEIDKYYKQYIPDKYAKQKRKAIQTPYHISNTSFTTVTLNVNYQTFVHTDKGDDREGFGNLSVIEHGTFTGGETCFPQYGIGVDVRTGDVLYMNVHLPHGNLPIDLKTPDAKRLSIVCYLRESIWNQTKGKTKKFMEKQNNTLKKIRVL